MNNILTNTSDKRQTKTTGTSAVTKVRNILMLLVMLCGINNAAWGDTWDGTEYSFAENKFAEEGLTAGGNDGKSWEKAYVITTARQLAYFAWIVKNNKTGRANAYYWKLGANIDLNGGNYAWSFGSNANGAFQGHFDGQDHTISNIKLNVTTNSNYGLLTTIQGANATNQLAEVKNLNISNVTFVSEASRGGNTRLGALAGYVKQAEITNVSVSNVTFTYTNTITGTNQLGGAIGCMENNTTLDDVDATGVTATFSATTTGLYVGGVVGASTGTANTNSMTGCDAGTVSVTHSSDVTGTTHMGGLVGSANTSLNDVNTNTVNGFTVNATSATGSLKTFYVGGLFGYCKGAAPGQVVRDNTATNVTITTAGTINDNRLAGLIGSVDGSGGLVTVKGNSATTVSITANGTTAGANYLGGFIGYTKGKSSPNERVLIQGNTSTSATVTMNGIVANTLCQGGFLGYADEHVNIFNNKVATPAISITNAINAETYVGGAIGRQTKSTTIDGMTVSGGSITGPDTDKNLKNNIVFCVGGFMGQQNASGTAAYQPNKFKNVAVTGININLGHYKPESAIQNHKFFVGGVTGSVNAPNQDANGWRGMPENIISKGVKIYAPYAMTSPTVPNFNTGAAANNNMTPDVVITIDAIEKAKVKTWYYNDYKLGISPEFLASDVVTEQGASAQHLKFRKNYVRDLQTIDGIKYLAFDETHNDDALVKSNRYLDSDRDCKTVLWWTQQASMDKSKGSVAAATSFTATEQPIYPQSGASSAAAGNLTEYPHFMYFFQGIANAKYANNTDAGKIVEGIEANFTNNVTPTGVAMPTNYEKTGVTVNIINNKETQRGFDSRTLTVSVENAAGTDVTGSYTYQWYVDGKADVTTTSKTLTPHWKNCKGITVNVLNGATVVATASYGFGPGMLHTQKSMADVASDPIRSDISTRGTKGNPYIIDCESALRQLSYLSTAHTSIFWETLGKPASPYPTNQTQGHYNRAYYELGADIDLQNNEFTPISHVGYSSDGGNGTYSQNWIFQGQFDGKGKKISNLKVTWTAGLYNAGANIYYGLFGAVGNSAKAPKWGDSSTNLPTVIKNLVIDGATFTHDTQNTSFYYNNGTSGNSNTLMVGVLAGIVSSNTIIQNIEILNSTITDALSTEYSLATKGLFVGGAIGSMQDAFNATTNLPANIQIQHIVAQVDITLTQPKFVDASKDAQLNQFNVGGIIGRYIATGGSGVLEANYNNTKAVMPAYTLYSGTINAPKAWISPVLGSLRYKDHGTNNGFAYYSKLWEGNNNTAETQIPIKNALYYKFKIGSSDITDTYPANTCSRGARTLSSHNDAYDAAKTYSALKYQGVNYNAIYVDEEDASLEQLNQEAFEGYHWVWSGTAGSRFPHLTTDPYKEATISREGNTFTAGLVGGTPTSYAWRVKFDDVSGWQTISGATAATYTAPASLKPKYIIAVVNDGTGDYRTGTQLVDADESIINPKVTKSDKTYTFNLNSTAPAGQLTTTYQWYQTKDAPFDPVVQNQSITLTDAQALATGGVVWCKVTITESGVKIYDDFIISGATVVYVKYDGGIDNPEDGSGNLTDRTRGWAPETPVATINNANKLLKSTAEGGTVDNNFIVVMGVLNPQTKDVHTVTRGDYANPFQSKGKNPATITGKYENTEYNGEIVLCEYWTGNNESNVNTYETVGHNCYVLADTKFENLTFRGTKNGNSFIECHGNDVTFGKGLVMTGFANLSINHGNFGGDQILPELTIILTATNLAETDIAKYTTRTKPQVVTFQSGHYGRIMGGRYTNGFFAVDANTSHTILGSAEHPVWAVVNIDIDKNNSTRGIVLKNGDAKPAGSVEGVPAEFDYSADINSIIAGLTDGTMYGDYTINFHGGKVAYIVGGNQGNPVPNRNSAHDTSVFYYKNAGVTDNAYNKAWGQWPNASYFGRTVINVEQDTNCKDIAVGDLYAGGLGRKDNGSAATSIVDMYYYGHTEVNLKSGSVGNVYGGGVGGVMGVNPWDAHVPYENKTADAAAKAICNGVQYGDTRYGSWSTMVKGTNAMAKVTLHNLNDAGEYETEQLDLAKSSTTVNVMGGTVNGNVYGGGYGFVEDMAAAVTMQGVGSVFGDANINITGGEITGSVYGGSRGHEQYYNQINKYGQVIDHIAEMNGTVNINITGTDALFPTIGRHIFGAGKGLSTVTNRKATAADVAAGKAENVNDTYTEEYADIARTGNKDLGNGTEYKSEVNITIDLPKSHPFVGNIYGGGENGKVDGNTNIYIMGGEFQGDIFGAGLGEEGHAETKAMVTGNTNVNILNADVKIYSEGTGNVYGGGSLGKVFGNTNVTVEDGTIEANVFGGGDRGTVSALAKVTLNGSHIHGNVFGGGNKAVVGTAATGDQLAVGVARNDWAKANGTSVVMSGENAKVFGDIFGGGNEAKVEGNTSVYLYNGMFGGNIFGGGNGTLNSLTNVPEVFADVTNNTSVYLEGTNVMWSALWDKTNKEVIEWDGTWEDTNRERFVGGTVKEPVFKSPHNVYGGGNKACRVAGNDSVFIVKGFANATLLNTDIWKNSFYDNAHPHFYVFGGGYGPFTTAQNTFVNVGVLGEYEDATTEEQLAKKFLANFIEDGGNDKLNLRANSAAKAKGMAGFTDNDVTDAHHAGEDDASIGIYDNSFGIPLYTVLGVLGGGYSGLISGNTNVTVGGETFIHRVYGGGYGSSVDYATLENSVNPSKFAEGLTTGASAFDAYNGDDRSLRDILGEVGGKTDVTVNGAFIYGDVFGGGAGVDSKEINSSLTDFVDMARVRGNGALSTDAFTKVTISDNAQIYGSVYGGGDIANVGAKNAARATGDPTYTPADGVNPASLSNVRSFVNVIGGDIYGEVFGGGGGRQLWTLNEKGTAFVQTTADADVLGRVEGNTLVHIANTPAAQTLTGQDEEPNIWQRIYGGGNLGSVNGNTKVWVEGGNIGHNIIGGGNGYAATDDAYTTAVNRKGTYANVYGNTNIVIDGGSIIWDKSADSQGNVTTWTNASKQLIKTEKEMRQLFVSRPDSIQELLTPYLDKRFFDYAEGDHSKMKFPINHNIYGGGRYACHVGTYNNVGVLTEHTGKSTVTLNHSLLTDENLLDIRTVAGLCWYSIVNNNSEPQFSVFGGGYGANTKVGDSQIDIQIDEADANYAAKAEDNAAWDLYENKLKSDWAGVTNEDKTKYYGGTNENAYRRYRTARYALSLGVPNHTYMNIYGGGYSGYVVNDTKVNVSGRSGMRNIYGGGLGAVKDRSVAHTLNGGKLVEASLLKGDEGAEASSLDYGRVGGSTDVNIQGGIISLNVYGGGAGVESRYLKAGALSASDVEGSALTDFPLMAHVAGTTNVTITGTVTDDSQNPAIKYDGTIIYGKVFGGGDVANVGDITKKDDEGDDAMPAAIEWVADNGTVAAAAAEGSDVFTSTIKIDGGLVMSQILAGGSGRPKTDCANYENLGGIYGNSRVIIKPNATDAFSPWLWNNIYGGGENGTVYGNSLVSISGGHLGYNIFGGGWGNVDGNNVSQADIKRNTFVNIIGGEYVLTQMWNDQARSWGENNQYNSPQFDYDTKKFLINHNIYGGGNYACEIGGNTYVKMTKGLLKSSTQVTYTGGAANLFETNEWRDVYNKTGSPHFSVYGGGFGANTNIKGGTNLDIALVAVDDHTIAAAPTVTDHNLLYSHFFSEQGIMDITGGGYSGNVEGKAHVKIAGDTFARRILGGGFYGSVGETLLDITSVDCSDIFGGGLMGNIGTREGVQDDTNDGTAKTSGNGVATINLGTSTGGAANGNIWIHRNVYGANDVSGSIYSAANINMYGGHVLGNIYGAGNGNYLYAQGDKNTKQVTVNEYYETAETTYDLVYTVPADRLSTAVNSTPEAAKMVNVNSYRPATQNVKINLQGASNSNINIAGNVFGGGNSATVNEIYEGVKPTVNINFGNYVTIGGVYLGCDGDAMFDDKTNFMNAYQDVNKVDLTHAIDWVNVPANKAVSTQYLPVQENDRPTVYKTNLDLYFQPVEMAVQPTVTWNGTASGAGLTNTTIGTFVCGGNRGNMNVKPVGGKIVDIIFPAGLTIKDKIVGGCNNANIMYKNTHHEGGYLLGVRNATAADASSDKDIALTVKCQFLPTEGAESGVMEGGNVYGGCYKSGTIRGDIFVDIQTNMLSNITREELVANKAKDGVALANVYGAGYGNDSYVYGNTTVLFGKGMKKTPASPAKGMKPSAPAVTAVANAVVESGAGANFIYGGGQQGNLIGNSLVRIYNGNIASSVCGGSYAGYMWGSTQVLVGYPKYYTCQKSGIYNLKRADIWNSTQPNATHPGKAGYRNFDQSDVIKQKIYLMEGDVVSEEVFQAIEAYDAAQATTGSGNNFSAVVTTSPTDANLDGWNDVDINIAEAVYGGGYSLASGSSVAAGTYTVKKYDNSQNLNGELSLSDLGDLNAINNSNGTKGFGGNTTVLVWDRATAPVVPADDHDHIAISTQSMKEVQLEDGDDLFGYYYNDNGTYRYIYQEGTYFYDATDGEARQNYFKNAWESDSEGGMYGDGHLSFAEGFRAGEINGYGFSGANPNGAKMINTFQRMDLLRVQDCSLALLGARDYTVTELSTTPYSIARVGELQMRSPGVVLSSSNLQPTTEKRSRNYIGFSNNIHYIGAIDSDVPFTADYHYGKKDEQTPGTIKSVGTSYRDEKQAYIDAYNDNGDETEFQKRNDGTAKNMIGIASGYAMKLQNVFTTDALNTEDIFYGPIVGVVEMNLINVREDEGGGYVYADNVHHRASDGSVPAGIDQTEDFLETSGNFVFPYDKARNRYIVDDCFPVNYYTTHNEGTGPADDTKLKGIHYWYVTGFNYYYNAHITGYTYDSSNSPLSFVNDNKDGLLVLSGAKEGQTVTLKSIKWRSNHVTAPVRYVEADLVNIGGKTYVKTTCDENDGEYSLKSDGTSVQANVDDIKIDNNGFVACDLETSGADMATACTSEDVKGHGNTATDGKYDHYNLSVSVPGASVANLPMNRADAATVKDQQFANTITGGNDPAITFQLTDEVNNEGNDYYTKYMAQPCLATVELSVPALNDDEVSHEATQDDVVAERAEKVGDKVVDTPATQIMNNMRVQYFFTRSGSEGSYVYTKVADEQNLVSGTKYYYLGYNNDYQELNAFSDVKVYNDERKAYLSVTSSYEQVNYADVADYNACHTSNLTQGEFNALSAEDKIKYHAVEAASIISGGSTSYYINTPRYYNYTIYLTIDYVLGPSYTGKLKVYNCALPGEMIKIDKGTIQLTGDQTFSQSGTTYKFGKRKLVGDKWQFVADSNYPVYNYNVEATGSSEMLKDVRYDKDGDYILVPAYYFMNGYGVQYSFKVNNLDQNFDVDMDDDNTLLIHNYHRMLPRSSSGEEYALDQHLDLAAKRHKLETDAVDAMVDGPAKETARKAILPQPRIYLVDNLDLNKFGTFLNQKADGSDVVGSKYDFGANMQFFLQRDITAIKPGDQDDGKNLTPYAAPTDFNGMLHGDGHVISGLDQLENKYLLTANHGNIYNLGLTTGVITNGDDDKVTAATAQGATDGDKAALNNTLYHCCYTYAPVVTVPDASASVPHVVYRMNGTAFTGYTEDDWRYGKVAYDLNQYYLDSRYARHQNTPTSSTDAAHAYVENYYANGDYLYADYSGDNHYNGSEFLRTTARPNYGQPETKHDINHTIDASRAVGYVAAHDETPASCTGYQPLFEEVKVSGSLADVTTTKKNDYLFWGQRQNSGTKDATLGTVNTTLPASITADLNLTLAKSVHLVDDMANRVYRAAGYYSSTVNNGYYYNHAGYAHNNEVTAIDFYGYSDPTAGEPLAKTYTVGGNIGGSVGSATGTTPVAFYQPIADYGLTEFAIDNDVTRNLLVYANSNADLAPSAPLGDYVYDESLDEEYITAHTIGQTGEAPDVAPQATYLHLVERTPANLSAAPSQQYNNDLCVPLQFTVNNRAWYTRQPMKYAESNNDAWEGICLPFTVSKVEASLNREITHFYGVPTQAELDDPATNSHTLHHEYWLRGLTNVKTGEAAVDGSALAGKKIGVFQRPGTTTGLFINDDQTRAAITSYHYANNFFVETYGENNYNSTPAQNAWYTSAHDNAQYLPLTTGVPYVVSFPGNRYYEFDLSSKFYNSVFDTEEPSQTVTFNAYGTEREAAADVTVPVTADIKTADLSDTHYAHIGTYMQRTDDGIYAINEAGTLFQQSATPVVLPFRTFMAKLDGSGNIIPTSASPAKSIYIGAFGANAPEQIGEEQNDPQQGIAGPHLYIYPQGKRVIVDATYPATLYMYTVGGTLMRVLDVRPGINTYSGFPSGIYIIGQTKIWLQ